MPIMKYLHFILWLTSLKSRVDGNTNCFVTTYSTNWTVVGVCYGNFTPLTGCGANINLCRWNISLSHTGNLTRTFNGQYTHEDGANNVNCRVTCSFKTTLPASEGKYSYTVEIDKFISNISLEILSPEPPSVSSCPMFAPNSNESSVTCNCTTSKYGHPTGILTWPGYSNTSQVTVSRSDQDSVFTCQLTWGAHNWTVVYNPRACGKTNCSLIMNGSVGTVLGSCERKFPYWQNCEHYKEICRWDESVPHKEKPTRSFAGQPSSERSANDDYCLITCQFTASLPASEGKYVYRVQIVNVTSSISLEILSPESPSVSSCPMFALNSNERSVTCNCTTANPGLPHAILRWSGYSNTSQVTVSRSNQDTAFTCQLTWGIHNWTVVYKPKTRPPSSPPVISGYSSGQLLLTGSSLTLVCRVTGGHPLVSSIEFNCGPYTASQGVKFKDSVISTLILDELNVSHDGILCSCSATWPPNPQLYLHVTSVTLNVIGKASNTRDNVGSNGTTSLPPENIQLNEFYSEITLDTEEDYHPSVSEIEVGQLRGAAQLQRDYW